MSKKLRRCINNRQGQVAIFIAMIFPVLFLFFAMIINVGLLVHHKINLQNSVDIAAYYGAAKQAEMLNAIAHTNYQIRQSWKLLSWRYRQLGTAGDYNTHPYDKDARQIRSDDIDGYPENLSGAQKDYYDSPAFCVTYVPFHPMPGSESTCKYQSSLRTINLFRPPPVIAGFLSLNASITAAATAALNTARKRCEFVGQFNYFILGEFLVAFNRDQGERKQLINMLSRGLSESTDNFREISGELVSEGIRATLENNLTEANKAKGSNLKLTVVNGLGLEGCNAVGQADTQAAKWLSEIKIAPAFVFMDSLCDSTQIRPIPKELGNQRPDTMPNFSTVLSKQIENLSQFIGQREAPYNSSVGFEKNPWCMAYVGVKAETTPNIPFMPLNGVKLKAQGFAKPFGGKIGPWYNAVWTSGSSQSNGGKRSDPLLPSRLSDKGQVANYQDASRAPNYSRFVGDKFGMKSRAVQGQWGRAIYNLDATWSSRPANKLEAEPLDAKKSDEPNFNHWNHLQDEFGTKKTGDILAWDNEQDAYPRMRSLELAAILPDQFDLTYYSIDPDFYHNYYIKIKEGYIQKVPGFKYLVRPDLGVRLGNKNYTEYSIREQYKALEFVKTDNPQIPEPKVDFEKKLLYVALDVAQVLTSWVGKNLKDYSLDEERFGKCLTKPLKNGGETIATSGDCIIGGRTGYSVKLVSSDYLYSEDLDLGGENAGPGKIINPPPK
ncbi:MAG: Tad domain-containing protein [Bdellovibrionaceae bacterium]|nr:Tad domain-containing protein [Pseudobdellovibrionaceae bacterium]